MEIAVAVLAAVLGAALVAGGVALILRSAKPSRRRDVKAQELADRLAERVRRRRAGR